MYSKTEPPAALAQHIKPDDFEKSQKYGKDKAKFALFSKLFSQCLDSVLLQAGFYAWCWGAAGSILARFGYGSEYEVREPNSSSPKSIVMSDNLIDCPINRVHIRDVPPVVNSQYPTLGLLHLCLGRKARIQQDHPRLVRCRSPQRMGGRVRLGHSVPCCIPLHL